MKLLREWRRYLAVAVVCLVVGALAVAFTSGRLYAQRPLSYDVALALSGDDIRNILKRKGAEGCELVTAVRSSDGYYLICKK